MEIPLVLRKRSGGKLVYAIPAIYRASMALGFAVVLAALFLDGRAPGLGGWVALIVVALAGLYEDRWIFDRDLGVIIHRAGLLPIAREKSILLGDVTCLRLSTLARGTVPGSAEEEAVSQAAYAGTRPDYSLRRGRNYPKAYFRLVLEFRDGSKSLIYLSGTSGSFKLRDSARRIAEHLGIELVEGPSKPRGN